MNNRQLHAIAARAFVAFQHEAYAQPTITLRGGNALDDCKSPPQYDPEFDRPTDAYIERFPWGIGYLDPESFRHYLPHLIEYALRHASVANDVVDALLSNLRPPDREPPRLASLSPEQEEVVVQFLDTLAFSEESVYEELAAQTLEEWWVPNALYRPGSNDA